MRNVATGLASVAIALASALASRPALAEETGVKCIAAYESGQETMRAGKYASAREQLIACRDLCPSNLAKDCAGWLTGVDPAVASLQLNVVDEKAQPVFNARVLVDGKPVSETVPTTPLALDAGPHRLRVERSESDPAEVSVTVAPSDRGRELSLTLVTKPVFVPAPRIVHGSPLIAYGSASLGAAALFGGGIVWAVGEANRLRLRSSCYPGCNPADVQAINTQWWVAGGLGVAGLALGAVAWATWPRVQPTKAASLEVHFGPGSAVLRGSFE